MKLLVKAVLHTDTQSQRASEQISLKIVHIVKFKVRDQKLKL